MYELLGHKTCKEEQQMDLKSEKNAVSECIFSLFQKDKYFEE
jgi:hypothetical protein